MNLTHKAIAMMCGFSVRIVDNGSYWYHSPTNDRGNVLAYEKDAWKAACTDNDLIEPAPRWTGGPR